MEETNYYTEQCKVLSTGFIIITGYLITACVFWPQHRPHSPTPLVVHFRHPLTANSPRKLEISVLKHEN